MPRHFQPDDLVDWPARLAVERPLVERVLADAPKKRVFDLGCGTGHHARLIAGLGYEVLAIDTSESTIEQAQAMSAPPGVDFVVSDMGAVERTGRGHYGAAVSLGNSLAYLISPESLSRMFFGLKRRLVPGAPILLQLDNYDRVVVGGQRELPPIVVPDPDGDLAVVRQLEPREDGVVLQSTEVRRVHSTPDSEIEILDNYSELLQGWRRNEIEELCEVSRLKIKDIFGDMTGSPYDSLESPELVVTATA